MHLFSNISRGTFFSQVFLWKFEQKTAVIKHKLALRSDLSYFIVKLCIKLTTQFLLGLQQLVSQRLFPDRTNYNLLRSSSSHKAAVKACALERKMEGKNAAIFTFNATATACVVSLTCYPAATSCYSCFYIITRTSAV